METIGELLKLDLEFSTTIKDDYKCIICDKILVNAMFGLCGCQYCEKCINNSIEFNSKFCPGTTDDCLKTELIVGTNVLVNHFANKRIEKLNVKCPFDGCDFTDQLKNMLQHVRLCDKRCDSCPYAEFGCNDENVVIKDGGLKKHLFLNVIEHTNLLTQYLQRSRNEEKERAILFDKSNNDVVTILDKQKNDINELKLKYDNVAEEKDELKIEFQTFKDKILIEMADIKNTNEQMKLNWIKVNETMRNKILLMKIQNDPDKKVNFEWKVNDWKILKSKGQMLSQPFFSHNGGYKLCLAIGRNDRYGICLIAGPHDEQLEWPCNKVIQLRRLHPVSREVVFVYNINYNDVMAIYQKYLDKPIGEKKQIIWAPKEYIPPHLRMKRIDYALFQCKVSN